MEGVILNMANKRVFKLATASAVAASALVAAVPASAASVTYDEAVKHVEKARVAANELHAAFTKGADYETRIVEEYDNARRHLVWAEQRVNALTDAKQKSYLNSRLDGLRATIARTNDYNNAVRVGTEILPAAHMAVTEAADVASLKEGNILLAAKIKQAKETFPKVYGKEMQAKFASLYLTAELEADRKDGYYAEITAERIADGLKLVAEGKVEEAEEKYNNAKVSFDAVKGLEVVKTIIGADWAELGKKVEAAKTPKVESVSAINLKTVEVKFNKKMDETTAETVANYSLDNVALVDGTSAGQAKAVLSEDGKTVTLTFATPFTTNTSHTLKTSGIKDVQGTVFTSEAKLFVVTDTVAPSVANVEYSGGKVVVSFNDYLDQSIATTDLTFRVNGTPVVPSYGTDGKSLEATYAVSPSATASVYVAKAKDIAGNEMGLYNGSVTAPAADNSKPYIVSASQVSQDTVRFVLSENVGSELATGDIKLLKGTQLFVDGTTVDLDVTQNTTLDSTGKTYDLKIDLDNTATGDQIFASGSNNQALTFLIDAGAFKDSSNNLNDAYSAALNLVTDTTAPSFVSGTVATNKANFELEFNEDLVLASDANIIVTNADGVRFPLAATESAVSGKKFLVDISTAAGTIADGTYTIQVPAGALKDRFGNTSAAFTTTVTVTSANPGDTAKPAVAIANSGINKFTATFTNTGAVTADEVTSATALNLSNYKLDGNALPAGTQIYFTSAAKNVVEIVLPENSVNIGVVGTGANAVLTVSNVADKAGNIVDPTSATVKITDNTAATLQSAKLLGDTVELTFNENLDAATAPANIAALLTDFSIFAGTTAFAAADVDPTVDADGDTVLDEAATAVVTVSGNKLTFTITGNESNWSTVKAGTLTVKTDGALLEDANGLAVKDAVQVTVVK
jgi:trimeric autotransporter adhesin